MNFAIVDDRGLNDLERVNDNKLLAKQVNDLLEEKKLRSLDNVSKK
jgi:hypothetical protein